MLDEQCAFQVEAKIITVGPESITTDPLLGVGAADSKADATELDGAAVDGLLHPEFL
jgi:hypothetical protein